MEGRPSELKPAKQPTRKRDKRDLPWTIQKEHVYRCCSHCGSTEIKRFMEEHWERRHPLLLAEAKERGELALVPGKDPMVPEDLWGVQLLDKVGWRSYRKDPVYVAYLTSYEKLTGKKLERIYQGSSIFQTKTVNRTYKKGTTVKCPNLGFSTMKKRRGPPLN